MNQRFQSVTLLVFILIAFLPAVTGALYKPGAWYESLARPTWTPPNWVFAPAWTFLYFTIGIAGYLAWTSSTSNQRLLPFTVYGLQLASNGLWTWLFFGLHRPVLALVDLAVLWLAIIVNMVLFYGLNRASAYLLAPYFLWVTFAAFLNAAIVRLN